MGSSRKDAKQKDRRLSPAMVSFRLLVVGAVREYIAEHGASPSYAEIAAKVGSSRDRAKKAIVSAARAGLLVKVPGPRGLSLPSAHEEALRQLKGMGYIIDDSSKVVRVPGAEGADLPLLPPAELDYIPPSTGRDMRDGQENGTDEEAA